MTLPSSNGSLLRAVCRGGLCVWHVDASFPSAVEVESLKDLLPNVIASVRVEEYEHLDLMWADTAKKTVFPKVLRYTAFPHVCSMQE